MFLHGDKNEHSRTQAMLAIVMVIEVMILAVLIFILVVR